MSAKSTLILVLCFIIKLSFGQAQDVAIESDLSVGKMKSRATHALKTGDVYTALFYYEEIVKRDSQDLDTRFQLAEMYRFSRNYTKAEETYAHVYLKSPSKYPLALYYKGLMQKMNGKYEDAKANMLAFKKEGGNLGDKDFKALLNKEIAGCDSGIVFREFPDNIVIKNPGDPINHPHTEFSPVLLDSNTLIYGSLRMETLSYFDIREEHQEKQPVRQIYKASKVNDKWEEQGLYEILNDPGMDMGNIAYSANSDKYYFSKCSKDIKGHVTCKIYSTEKVNGEWSAPKMLPSSINMDGYTATQPAILLDTATVTPVIKAPKPDPKNKNAKSAPKASKKPQAKANNTEYLYFVSDRPGGKGGLDIWYTYYNSTKKEWVAPINFALINTGETECTPYYHIPSQTFYFSSNGQATSGGLDVFKTKKEGRRFTKPQNMAFPINSPQDDLGFTLGTNGDKGLLVSNRPGGTPYFHETCCDDIYAFDIMPAKPFVCTLNLALIDEDSTDCKDQLLKVSTYDLKTKKQKEETVTVKDCKFQLPLEKNQVYKFTVTKEGYQKDTLVFETRDMASSDKIEKKLVLRTIKKEEKVFEKPVEGVAFVLKDIQYETNQVILNEASMTTLDSVLVPFLKMHPTDKLVINSHTDDQGSHKYNQDLSQQRADNVAKYLISKGIEGHRLHSKGFGEVKPIAANQNPDGSDNPFGRGINRRTEFLILKPHEKAPH